MKQLLLLLTILTVSVQAQNSGSQRLGEIEDCNRHGSLRDFIQTCMFKIGGTKEQRTEAGSAKWKRETVQRIFSLSRSNTITRIANPGAMTYIQDIKHIQGGNGDNTFGLAESLNQHGDRGLYALANLNEETVNEKNFKWKWVKYTCEGYRDAAGKPIFKSGFWNRTLDEKGMLYYSKVRKKSIFFTGLYKSQLKYLNDNPDAWEWTDKELAETMNKVERKQLRLYEILEKRSNQEEIYQVVSIDEGVVFYIFKRSRGNVEEDKKYRWEILAIDDTDCSA